MRHDVIQQLRKAIRESGETQLAIAEATGVAQGNLSRFLRGERGLSLDSFAKLCRHFRLHLTITNR